MRPYILYDVNEQKTVLRFKVGSVAILLVVVLTWFGVKNGVPALFVTSAVLGGGCGWFIWVAWSNRDEIVTNRGADLT